MKTKILNTKTFFQLILFTSLSLFYSCSQDKFEPLLEEENVITEDTENDKIANLKAPEDINIGIAWAWYDGNNAPDEYQYNLWGGRITVNRISEGYYVVAFPGPAFLDNGIIHTSAYNGNHSTQVADWYIAHNNKLVALIRSFDPSGNPTDGKFVVLLYKKKILRYTEVNDAYKVSNSDVRNFNSKRAQNTIRPITEGSYYTQFNRIEDVNGDYRDRQQKRFLITPFGHQPRRCKIGYNFPGNNGANAFINTFDFNGNRADSDFVLSYNEKPNIMSFLSSNAVYLHYNGSVLPLDSGATVTFIGDGRYHIRIHKNLVTSDKTMAIVSSYGNDSSYTNIEGWYRTESYIYINVRSYNPDGTPITDDTAQFNVLYQDNSTFYSP